MIALASVSQVIDIIDLMPEKMDRGVFVRLTERDRKDILKYAKAERRKVSDWIRGVLLDEISRKKEAALKQKVEEPEE